MSWVAAGIAGGSALLKLGEGFVQKGQANSIDKNNPFPTAPVQSEYEANVRQAQGMAQQGMPAQQYNNQVSAINRDQAGGLYAAGQSPNPTANIASIVRQGNDANSRLNSQDAVMKNQNMLRLLQERQTLAQQKDKAWDWNYQQKYLGNLAKSNSLRGSSNANINGGLNDLSGTALTSAKLGAFGGDTSNGMNAFNAISPQVQSQEENTLTSGNNNFNSYLQSQQGSPQQKSDQQPLSLVAPRQQNGLQYFGGNLNWGQ